MPTTAIRPVPTTAGPLPATVTVTYGEAADLRGVSPDTVKRDRERGLYPNAFQAKTGKREWRIPLGDLVAASHLDASLVTDAVTELGILRESRELRGLREQIIRLETQLAAESARHAELVADKNRLLTLCESAVQAAAKKVI